MHIFLHFFCKQCKTDVETIVSYSSFILVCLLDKECSIAYNVALNYFLHTLRWVDSDHFLISIESVWWIKSLQEFDWLFEILLKALKTNLKIYYKKKLED